MITSATIRKITNGFILSTTVTVVDGIGPTMLVAGQDQYFATLTDLFRELENAGFDSFIPVTP